MNHWNIGRKTRVSPGFALIDIEDSVREIASADNQISTLSLSLGENLGSLLQHSRLL